jgi:hypothetical protein
MRLACCQLHQAPLTETTGLEPVLPTVNHTGFEPVFKASIRASVLAPRRMVYQFLITKVRQTNDNTKFICN